MSEVIEIDLNKLFIGKLNVRKSLGDITELAESIRQVGILEPLLVRERGDKYEIIAGTRRFAAAKMVGLKTVPCVVKELSDEEALIVSVTENVQRGDLTEEEIVECFLLLRKLNPTRWSQAEFAKRLGKSHTWISSRLTAYEALQKLRAHGLSISMKSSPRREERETGVLPVGHLAEIEYALRSSDVRKAIPEEQLDEKRVELVEAVRDLPYEEAKRVIDRFRMYPERPIKEIREQVEARRTGVQIGRTYLPPRVARELDEFAEQKHTTMEEVLPEVIEMGLKAKQLTLSEGEAVEEEKPILPPKLDVPLPEQYHQQRMWNLQQIIGADLSKRPSPFMFDVITVGFSQKSVEGLIEALKAAGVELLIDVRRNPVSQYRPEFNKSILSERLHSSGIDYRHIPELGIPRSLRNQALSGSITPEELFNIYDREILTDDTLDRLEKIMEGRRVVAFLCTEVSPKLCHRHRIALALKKRGKITYDL